MSDKSVIDQIKHYQRDIIKSPENAKRMIRCIERLMVLPVTIAHLQETGVGRSVNELRKCGGEVGAAANSLVCKWKSMVQAEDSDVESDVEENEDKETNQVSSPDIRDSPINKNDSVDKYKNDSLDKYKNIHYNEENRKQKSDSSSKKSESSNPDNRHKSSEKKGSDKHDQNTSHRSKSSRTEHESGSDSKHSSSRRHKSDHDSRSNDKSHSSHRSDSERNGEIKTERHSSKTKHDEKKISKHPSSESKNKDVKQKSDKEKYRREESSRKSEKKSQRREESSLKSISSNGSKKYDVRKIDSESSDDDEVYKPRSKKRKKSVSEEDEKPDISSRRRSESEENEKHHNDKYSGRSKPRDFFKHESSEESDSRNGSEVDENSRSSSQNSNEYENEEMSNRSSPNNVVSDNEVESDSRKSDDSHSEKASDSEDGDASPEMEVYVPTKIKREKESPSRHSKTSSEKIKSSHSRSSSYSSSSHNSSSRTKNDKESSNRKGVREDAGVKIKKEKDEKEDSKKRREEKSVERKVHKSSNSHSSSSNKESSRAEKKVKIKIEKEHDGSIDCESGASFADALMGLSEPKKKSVKRKSTPSTPEKPSKSVDGKSKSVVKAEPRISSSPSSSSKSGFREPDLLSKNIKLEPLDVDLNSTLPEISPHYKPLPHHSPPCSPPGKRSKQLSQEEALSSIMSTKNQRTKVYSGNKTGYLKVPSLFDLCIQVLRDNIEALEYTGGVPYDLLKPVLDRATAAQLFQLEHYNPYLVEDTDGLWKFHCNKDFRGKQPDEFETWRELYVRLLDERERKLEALKANITQSMAKNTPVRQTKLAYVDSVVKPPRNIAKKQMKFGTGKAVKHDLVSKAMVGAAGSSPAPAAVPVPAPPASSRTSQSNAFPIPGFLKKKKAPLMQKTLQLIKGNRFKR